jgi:phage I-like protein
MKIKPTPSQIAIAACLFEFSDTVSTEIQLLPAGLFKARDGRPSPLKGWFIDTEIASALIAQANSQQDQLLIDYEHQTLNAVNNGQPNPASGWFKELEWREGVGLFAVNVDWTAKASAAIAAKEYRYISPVFTFDKTTGAVTSLLMAALVNTPALDGMKDLTALATSFFSPTLAKGNTMETEELLERLRYMLNLPTLSTVDEVMAELDKLKAAIQADSTAAAGISLGDLLAAKNTAIAALKSQTPNPAEFVPVSVMSAIQTELAALKADLNTDKVSGLVTAALSDGRLLPAQKAWALSLGVSDIAALSAFLSTAQPVAALSRMQSGGHAPADEAQTLTVDELAMCKNMGITEARFLASKEVVA